MAKTGVDDFLATGGTVEDLIKLSRPFDPADFASVRMSRDDRLRADVEDLWRRWRGHKWRTQGDYTARSILRVLIRAAEQRGKPVEGGIRIIASKRTLALEAAVSSRAPTRAIPRLEASGFLRRDNAGRKRDQAGAFILLTEAARYCPHNGKGTGPREGRGEETSSVVPYDRRGDTSARPMKAEVPELRWPTIKVGRELDRRGRPVAVYDYIARLGKKRGSIVEHLVEVGGVCTVAELMARFAGKRTRTRDFKRRTLAMLTEAPAVIVVEGDVVSLGGQWREALEHARQIAGEIDHEINGRRVKGADTLQREKYARQREAFRRRDEVEAEPVPDMRSIPDLRKPWPVHPERCACPLCVERFGAVEGEHVEGCNCADCFTAHKEAARENGHRGRPPSGVVSLPRRQRGWGSDSPQRRSPPAPVVEHEAEESEHPWHCGCPDCYPEPKYARPFGGAS
jgi:hypothetical protein